jgi:hypothetical protein
MASLRTSTFLVLAVLWTAAAHGQMGLYGAPEPLPLPLVQSAGYGGNANIDPQAMQRVSAMPDPLPGAPLPQPPAYPVPAAQADTGRGFSVFDGAAQKPAAPAESTPCQGGACAAQGDFFSRCLGGGAGCDSCPWYASLSALVMTRDNGNKRGLSVESDYPSEVLMTTRDANPGWEWGGELVFGRRFCCNQWSLDVTYWTLCEFKGSATGYFDSCVDSELDFSRVQFNGVSANDWFDYSTEHRLWRTDEVHNVELNLTRNHLLGDCGPLSLDLTTGLRYFRFRERLVYGALAWDCAWGADGGADEAYLNDEVANNLIGFQIGCNAEWRVTPSLRVFVTPKIGIYDNYVQNKFSAYLGDGTPATQDQFSGRSYPVSSSHNSFSVLSQIDLGLAWQIAPRWDARVGYRLMAVTGMGLAENQIPDNVADIPTIAGINSSGSLVLHGAFFGVAYCF